MTDPAGVAAEKEKLDLLKVLVMSIDNSSQDEWSKHEVRVLLTNAAYFVFRQRLPTHEDAAQATREWDGQSIQDGEQG